MLQLTFAVTLGYFLRGSFHKCFINLEGFKLMKSSCRWEGFHLLCRRGNWGSGTGMCRGRDGVCESCVDQGSPDTSWHFPGDETVLCIASGLGFFCLSCGFADVGGSGECTKCPAGTAPGPCPLPPLPSHRSFYFPSSFPFFLFSFFSPFLINFSFFFLFSFFLFFPKEPHGDLVELVWMLAAFLKSLCIKQPF